MAVHCHMHLPQHTKQPSWPMVQSRADVRQKCPNCTAAVRAHAGTHGQKPSRQQVAASHAFTQQGRLKTLSGFCSCQRRQPKIVCSAEPKAPSSNAGPLQDDGELVLNGKHIIVTAPRQYAAKLALGLIAAGARPLWVPSIRISRILDQEDSMAERQLKNLFQFDHIVFTSKNGIYAVFDKLFELHGGREAAMKAVHDSKAYFWALGADADLLRKIGVRSVQTPMESSAQGLVKELHQRKQLSGARILCPVPLVTGGLTEPGTIPSFLSALQRAGAEAIRLNVYKTSPGADAEVEKQLLVNGQIDAIVFGSSAEAQGLARIMGGADVIQRAVHEHKVLLAAHGPYTAAGASQVLQCPIECVNKNFSSFAGMIVALQQHYDGSSSQEASQP